MGKSPENHEQECKSAGHVATAAQLSSLITVRSVIRTASDDSCGGGLGTRLQVMHAWIIQYAGWIGNAREIRKHIKINPRNGCNGLNYGVCILREIENGDVCYSRM